MGKSKHVVISRVQRSSPTTLISNKKSSFQKDVDLTVQEQGRDTIGIQTLVSVVLTFGTVTTQRKAIEWKTSNKVQGETRNEKRRKCKRRQKAYDMIGRFRPWSKVFRGLNPSSAYISSNYR